MTKITSREGRLALRPSGVPTVNNFTLAEITLEPLRGQQVLEGGAIGEVIESRSGEFKTGDVVTSRYGWREAFIAEPKELDRVDKVTLPLSVYLGVLGMIGKTAWARLTMVEVKAGDVIYISGAAGAVGHVAV